MASTTGMAFSGGGIRSAALCSGVLRRMLQKGVTPDYLSCVSGGGYTGTAYLDWKFRHDQKDDPAWHKKFFERMRKGAIFCDWTRPVVGCLDTVVLILLVLFVLFLAPAVVVLPYACPLANLIDYAIGDILRSEEPCPGGFPSGSALNSTICIETGRSDAYRRSELFAILLALSVLFFVLGKLFRIIQDIMVMLTSTCLFMLMFVFLPWFTHEYLSETPYWMKGLVFFLCAVIWFSVPLMREQASMITFIFLYSYVIYWRVYKSTFLDLFAYSDRLFTVLLIVSGMVLWLAPAVVVLQQRLVHIYNRWRLQKAFFSDAGAGEYGCGGITMADCFIGIPDYEKQSVHPDRPLTLADLQDMKPHYICNTVLNKWQRHPEDATYKLFTLSPTGIECLDGSPGEHEVGSLSPRDIDLSEAMATSAAALSRHMGKYEEKTEAFRDLTNVLGIAFGADVLTDPRAVEEQSPFLFALPFFFGFVQVLPLVIFPSLHLAGLKGDLDSLGVFIFFAIMLLLALVALTPQSHENPGIMAKISRWIVCNVAAVRHLHSMLSGIQTGPNAPPIVSLSDGGHYENLGLLPLLKMRLKKIVVVDGGTHDNDADLIDMLKVATDLARENLRCSFSGTNGRDVAEDFRSNFVEKVHGKQPRSYRFKVQYYDKTEMGQDELVGEGEILLVAPRHPTKGVAQTESLTWDETLRDLEVHLETGLWGPGPILEAEEVDRLTFCCCECCHGSACQRLSEFLCGSFPFHSTANQMFTPRQFTTYHREGYRACLEAEAAEFLLGE